MINLKQAIEIYYSTYPTRRVDSVLNTSDEWVIAGFDAQTGYEIDELPLGINKADGSIRIFHPLNNLDKLKTAVVVDKSEYSAL